jgi:hypothetical protein
MGEDILFDCDLRSDAAASDGEGDAEAPVTRVI